jgi:hypothetical protein
MLCFAPTLPGVVFLHWPTPFAILGSSASLLAPSLVLLGLWECLRYQRSWRVLIAIIAAAIATLLTWGTAILYSSGIIESRAFLGFLLTG